MKTYTVLYAEDVPHYGSHDIEAENDQAAIKAAIALHERGDISLNEAAWDSTVCARIVHIEDPDGRMIAADKPLDDYSLRGGGDADRLRCEAAEEMLDVLLRADNPHWVANAALTDDIEALRNICLYHADWWNNRAWPAIVKAFGGDEDAALKRLLSSEGRHD
jgi:hypothetical protein